jgi:hypothetical protein
MRKVILTALLVSASAFPAYAANDLALCKLRDQHVATQGVAYQPGIDVHGKPVVPADVNAAPSVVPDVVRIPLTIDLAQRLNNVQTGMELKADTGMVEIHNDGRVTFNGQDLSKQAAVVCGEGQVPVQQAATAPMVPPAAPAPAVAEPAPVPPATPVAPATARPTKIVVPVDAPPVPMATVPVATAPSTVVAPSTPRVAAPVTSRIDVRDTPITSNDIPADAVASPALPPQTLGQFTIPANPEKTNKILAAPATVSKAPTQTIATPAAPSGATNEELEKNDEIIWGEGN